MPVSLERLRADLPGLRGLTFLNFAATAPMLASSADVMAEVAREGREPLSEHFERWLARVEHTRAIVASVIGSRPDQVAFTTNTSSALSLVAAAVRWEAGQRVLYPADEFPSNRYVWQNLADVGVLAEAMPVEEVSLAEQLASADLDGVRAVAFSAVSFRDGRVADVPGIARLCRERGILTIVDAIQAVGAVPVDVRAWGCDFVACGGQKWLLGPVGTAFLYIRSERLQDLRVPLVGWASSCHAGEMYEPRLEFCEGARRFEPGLPDVAAIAALGNSLETLANVEWPVVFDLVAANGSKLRRELSARGYRVIGTPSAGIVTCEFPDDESAEALRRRLHERRIVVTLRGRELRASAHAITSDEDIDRLLECLAPERSRPARPAGRPTVSQEAYAAAPAPRRWKTALVTGASGGLGGAIARELARRGCDLLLVARNSENLESAARDLSSRFGIQARPCALDLSDPEFVAGWVSRNQHELGQVDVMVNNAAEAHATLFGAESADSFRSTMEVNLFTPWTLGQAVLPGMLERGQGAILNVVTSGARCALPLFSGYSASKAALWAWSEALGREVAGSGVTVLSFVPDHMDTVTARQLGREALAHYTPDRASATSTPSAMAKRAIDAIAAGRNVSMPWSTRMRVVFNTIAPDRVTASVLRRYRSRPS